MRVFIERSKETKELDFTGPAHLLLEKLGVNAETIVITRNGEIITEDMPIGGDDDIKLISVVSGG